MIENRYGGAGGTGGGDGGESVHRFADAEAQRLAGVQGLAAAHGENHVRIPHRFLFCQRGNVFFRRFTAVPEEIKKARVPLRRLRQSGTDRGGALFAADHHGGLPGGQDLPDFFQGVFAHRPGRERQGIIRHGCNHGSFTSQSKDAMAST